MLERRIDGLAQEQHERIDDRIRNDPDCANGEVDDIQ